MTGSARSGGLLPELDAVTLADLGRLARWGRPPCVSLLLPTHRAGPATRQDPIRFRTLLDRADGLLRDQGVGDDERAALLRPGCDLLDDAGFWRRQAAGLALYAAPGLCRWFRVPVVLAEEVWVGDVFRLRPLLRLVSDDGDFHVLALSQNEVRMFACTRSTISEVDLGDTPRSLAQALAHEDPEAQLQVRPAGPPASTGGSAMFHGHGVGGELDKQALERFFRAVDRGLRRVLGDDVSPLVLATVPYYVPIFRAVTGHPAVVGEGVPGNPERREPRQLHAHAWQIVAPLLAEPRRRAAERIAEAAGTGQAETDLTVIGARAREGRVDTLVVSATEPDGPTPPNAAGDGASPREPVPARDEELIDRAVSDVLATGGSVFAASEGTPLGGLAAALLRY